MILTYHHLHCMETPRGAFNRAQLEVLGVAWPPKRGWLKNLIGTTLPDEKWELVLKLSQMGDYRERKQLLHPWKRKPSKQLALL